MFFARPNEYQPNGLYNIGHLILVIVTIIGITISIKKTKNMNHEQVKKMIQKITVFVWILEVIKIIFNLIIGNANKPNTYVPLYFCSIMLYAGIFSGYCKNTLKHVGDVFIATGGIVAGIIFLICPNTSLSIYPIFHYISIQSFVLHGAMIYLGILVNITGYVKIELKDFKYYATLIAIMSLIAIVFNQIFDSNLMFISKNYPGTPIESLYYSTGKYFTLWMIAIQIVVPYFAVWGILNINMKKNKKEVTL